MKIFKLLSFTVLLILASCTNSDKELISMLPKDYGMVAKINLDAIQKNIKVSDANGKVAFPNEIESKYKKQVNDYNKMATSGIDYSKPVYYFSDSKLFKKGLLAKVKDKSALEKAVKENYSDGVEESDGCQYIIRDAEIIIFNEDIVFEGEYTNNDKNAILKNAKGLIEGNDNSISEKDDAYIALDNDDAFVAYINPKRFYNQMGYNALLGDTSPMLTMFTELMRTGMVSQTMNINYTNNNIEFGIKSEVNEKSALIQQLKNLLVKPSPESLKFYSASNPVIVALSIKGAELVKNQNIGVLLGTLGRQYFIPKAVMLQFISGIDGEFTVGLDSWDASDKNYTITAKMRDPMASISLLKDISQRMGLSLDRNGEEYSFDNMTFKVKFGIKDGYFYLTSSSLPTTNLAKDDRSLNNLFSANSISIYANLINSQSLSNEYASNYFFPTPAKLLVGCSDISNIKGELIGNKYSNLLLLTPLVSFFNSSYTSY